MVVLLVQNCGNLGNLTCFWVNGTWKVSIPIPVTKDRSADTYLRRHELFSISSIAVLFCKKARKRH
jgi:hypothetical protein